MAKSQAAVVKNTRRAGKQGKAGASVSEQDRHHWIAEAAYYKAERRNFIPGHETIDWYEAELEVESRLRRK